MNPRYFAVKNEDDNVIGVVQHNGDDHEFDSALMNLICEQYDSNDVILETGFQITNFIGMITTIPTIIEDESNYFKEKMTLTETWLYQ